MLLRWARSIRASAIAARPESVLATATTMLKKARCAPTAASSTWPKPCAETASIKLLVKVSPGGALDNTFGNGGEVLLQRPTFNQSFLRSGPVALAVTPDCGVYVTGGMGADMSVNKYNPAGQLVQVFDGGETAFHLNGIPRDRGAANQRSVQVAADGSVYVASNPEGFLRILKLTSGGAPDTGWGTNGVFNTGVSIWNWDAPNALLDSNGRLLVSGVDSNYQGILMRFSE